MVSLAHQDKGFPVLDESCQYYHFWRCTQSNTQFCNHTVQDKLLKWMRQYIKKQVNILLSLTVIGYV